MRSPAFLAALLIISASLSLANAELFRPSGGGKAAANLAVDPIASGLSFPWSLAFLPDGRMLVTERPGDAPRGPGRQAFATARRCPARVRIRPGRLARCALDRDFAPTTRSISASPSRRMAAPAPRWRARALPMTRARLEDVRVIFPRRAASSGNHFGCRIVQMPDNNLFLTTGDHFTYRDAAQNLANHLGKMIRIRPDGSVPPDNPFVKRAGREPEIWSYGHRNMQGAALQPESGKPGPTSTAARRRRGQHHGGGQELRLAGDHPRHRLQRRQDRHRQPQGGHGAAGQYWMPSIAPSGMAFSAGDLFPAWRGHLFVGALAGKIWCGSRSAASGSSRRSGC